MGHNHDHDMGGMDGHSHGMGDSSDMMDMNMTTTHSMGGGGMHHMMMQMYFTTDWKEVRVLFYEWQMTEMWHLIVSCIALGIIAALYEGLKVGREHLLLKYGADRSSSYDTSGKGSAARSVRSRMCSCMHVLQSLLHIVQVTVSYLLMLVVMTFNVWLCISVVVGAGLGYFLFGWKRAVIMDANEHCH